MPCTWKDSKKNNSVRPPWRTETNATGQSPRKENKMADKKFKAEYANNLKTSKVRMAFAHIFAVDSGQYGQNKYKATALVPMENRDILKPIKAELLAVARKSWPNIKWGELEQPFKDGNNKPDWEGFPGSEYFVMKSRKKPMVSLVTGRDGKGKLEFERCDEADIKSGDFVRFGFSAFTYEREKEITKEVDGEEVTEIRLVRGLSLILESVLKVADGDAFGGGGGASNMDRFDDEEMDEVAVGAAGSDNPDNYENSAPADEEF